MELYAFNPGPLDESVLYDQEKHVSSAVWEGQERGALRCHEHTSKLDQWVLTSKQIEYIERAGFGYLRFIPAISLDNPLISALVERWRRETNTFHLTVGEMTVTLEDVAYLLGLPIDGEPVIGVTYTTCDAVCEKLLGKAPDPGYASGGMVKLSWLKECFSHCPKNAHVEDVKRYTRAYLLYLVGSTIFSTTTGNKVPVMYLPLFENFDHCGKYSWGAAALAFLYRSLGNASLRSQSTISGGLTLLQCWSYCHLNIGRPKLHQDSIYENFPLVLRWKGKISGPGSNRDITFYRKALDSLKADDVDWFPYGNIDPRIVPDDIASSLILGRSKTMLICFDKAERHLPDRCLRQYGIGICQPIPEPVERWERKSRGVDSGVDLSSKMESELREWSERHLNVVQCEEVVDDSNYMHWFLRISRRFIGRPIPLASEFQRMNAALLEVGRIADTMSLQGLQNDQIQSVHRIRYIIHECLRDQAGSVVAVASTPPETGSSRRGRAKERTRSKGTGKRRRKEELDQYHEVDRDTRELIQYSGAVDVDYVQQINHSPSDHQDIGNPDHQEMCDPDHQDMCDPDHQDMCDPDHQDMCDPDHQDMCDPEDNATSSDNAAIFSCLADQEEGSCPPSDQVSEMEDQVDSNGWRENGESEAANDEVVPSPPMEAAEAEELPPENDADILLESDDGIEGMEGAEAEELPPENDADVLLQSDDGIAGMEGAEAEELPPENDADNLLQSDDVIEGMP